MENGKKILNDENKMIEEQVVKYLIELSSGSTVNSEKEYYNEKDINDYYAGCKYTSLGNVSCNFENNNEFLFDKDIEEVDSFIHQNNEINQKQELINQKQELINQKTELNTQDKSLYNETLTKNKKLLEEVDIFITNNKINSIYCERPSISSELNIKKKDNKLYSDKFKNHLIEEIFKSINRLEITLKNYKL
jgi:hypothetical protein